MGIEWCGSKERRRRGGIDVRHRGVHGTKAAPISTSTRVKIAVVTCREWPVAAVGTHLLGTDRIPAEWCEGDDESGALLS